MKKYDGFSWRKIVAVSNLFASSFAFREQAVVYYWPVRTHRLRIDAGTPRAGRKRGSPHERT